MPRPNTVLTFVPSQNIGRLRELDQTMTDEELQLELFFNLSNDLFAIADKSGRFIKVNERWTRLLGWTADELLSVPFYNFIHPEDIERTRQVVVSMNGTPVTRFVNRYRSRDGSYKVLEWTSSKMHNGRTYAVARDITQMCQECPVNRACPHLKDAPHAAEQRRRTEPGTTPGAGQGRQLVGVPAATDAGDRPLG